MVAAMERNCFFIVPLIIIGEILYKTKGEIIRRTYNKSVMGILLKIKLHTKYPNAEIKAVKLVKNNPMKVKEI